MNKHRDAELSDFTQSVSHREEARRETNSREFHSSAFCYSSEWPFAAAPSPWDWWSQLRPRQATPSSTSASSTSPPPPPSPLLPRSDFGKEEECHTRFKLPSFLVTEMRLHLHFSRTSLAVALFYSVSLRCVQRFLSFCQKGWTKDQETRKRERERCPIVPLLQPPPL